MKKLVVTVIAALALSLSGGAAAQEDAGGSGGGVLPNCTPAYAGWTFYMDGHAWMCWHLGGGDYGFYRIG